MNSLLETVDWNFTRREVLRSGSVHLKGVLEEDLVVHLLNARSTEWHPLPEKEGVVQQFGSGAYETLNEADSIVRGLATTITAEFQFFDHPDVPTPSPFNEVSWSHYPTGQGHITAHRDPEAFTGMIAIATLVGSATFRIWDGDVGGHPLSVAKGAHQPSDWTVAAGDVVLIRANWWPSPNTRCPVHEALPPADGERVIMTLRSNANGAGGGYAV